MNLTAILLAIVALGAAAFGAEHYGETRGKALQVSADQATIDGIRGSIADQKAQASAMLSQLQAAVIAKQQADAKITQLQESESAKDATITARNRDLLAAQRLRVTVARPAADGCRPGGGGAVPSTPDAAGVADTITVDLPDATAGDLRHLVLDADQLADDYRKCYRFVYPGWVDPLNPAAPAAAPPAAAPASSSPIGVPAP